MPGAFVYKHSRVLIVVIVVITAALVIAGGRKFHQRRLHALFEGPCIDTDAREEARDTLGHPYYPKLHYDLSAYTGRSPSATDAARKPSLLDKPEDKGVWKKTVQGMHPEWQLDAMSGASKVVRLKSSSVYRARWVPRFLTIMTPADNSLFPPNLCAPFVEWNDVHNNFWQVTLTIPGEDAPRRYLTGVRRWRIPDNAWETLRTSAVDAPATVQVRGVVRVGLWDKMREEVHRSQTVRFRIATDAADEAIIYRLVTPPFLNRKTPDMFVRAIGEKRDRLFLSARRAYCLNCHTFSSKSGQTGKLCLQVRFVGRAEKEPDHRIYFAEYDLEGRTGRKVVLPFEVQMTTFMRWSPDETKLAFSANQRLATFYPIAFETQWAGEPTSDIAVYDTTSGEAALAPGASLDNEVEIYPSWTPDGTGLVYSRASKGTHPALTQFVLWRVPFGAEDATAERVCDVEGSPIGWEWGPDPEAPGKLRRETRSAYYVRFSPDGRWMSWVQSHYGSLIKASSEIYLMRCRPDGSAAGKPIRLACNAPLAADSWYSWSSNSRWIVFASKRGDGIVARLYMTHIDDDGNASPAVPLPIEDPLMPQSFNIPEFVAKVPPVDPEHLHKSIGLEAEAFNARLKSTDTHERKPEQTNP